MTFPVTIERDERGCLFRMSAKAWAAGWHIGDRVIVELDSGDDAGDVVVCELECGPADEPIARPFAPHGIKRTTGVVRQPRAA